MKRYSMRVLLITKLVINTNYLLVLLITINK